MKFDVGDISWMLMSDANVKEKWMEKWTKITKTVTNVFQMSLLNFVPNMRPTHRWNHKMRYEAIDSEWPRIMFYIRPQLQGYSLIKISKPVNHPCLKSVFTSKIHCKQSILHESALKQHFQNLRCESLMCANPKLNVSLWCVTPYILT